MKKFTKNIIMIFSIIAIILTIFLIKNNGDSNEVTLKCIASNSTLYVSKTCGHCALQKQILGTYLDHFTIIDCSDSRDKCLEAGITAVPTWIINGKKYMGKKSIQNLKELTGC